MPIFYIFAIICMSFQLFADPFSHVQVQKAKPQESLSAESNAETVLKPHAPSVADVVGTTEPDIGVTAEDENGKKVPLPETFFTTQEAAKAYSDTAHPNEKDIEDYFESQNFSYRDVPTPQDVVPSLQERKRRVAQALAEQQEKEKAFIPKNPLEPLGEGDKVPASSTGNSVENE